MYSAAIKSKNNCELHNWWFLFANFLFREIIHVFLDTYLPNGLDITLPSEDFTFLKKFLFGGILSFSHDPNLHTCDVSTDTVVLTRDQLPRIQADITSRRSFLY